MTIFEAQRRINTFDLLGTVAEVMIADKQVLTGLQRNQLKAGQSKDDKPIKPDYKSASYAKKKTQELGRALMTPNLYLTGYFYSTIFVNVTTQVIEIGSTDDLNNLEGRYRFGGPIFGLNTESKTFYVNAYLLPAVLEKFNNLFS